MLGRRKIESRPGTGAFTRVTIAMGLLAATVLAACSASVPAPTETDIARATLQWPDMEPGDLATGRKLYVGRCGSCHRLVRPSSRTPKVWPRKVEAMAHRAGLTKADQELITRYVVTIAERATLPQDDATPSK